MVTLNVNGQDFETDTDPNTPLLYVLRNELELNGAKFGCGLGQCGSCTVLVGDEPVFSCLTPISVLEGRAVVTLEGLGSAENPGPVQAAFIEAQAAQCGYCIPGMIMRTEALRRRGGNVAETDIRRALTPNLCRCGTHMRILRAARQATGAAEAKAESDRRRA